MLWNPGGPRRLLTVRLGAGVRATGAPRLPPALPTDSDAWRGVPRKKGGTLQTWPHSSHDVVTVPTSLLLALSIAPTTLVLPPSGHLARQLRPFPEPLEAKERLFPELRP